MSGAPYIITFASGKGGVGKSTLAVNCSVLAAQAGLRVILVDLDLGGPDAHLLLGELQPACSLADFMARDKRNLQEVALPVALVPGLRLIAGAGDTLRHANPNYGMKQRIARQLRRLDADVVIVDVGAGAALNALDFFLFGDERVVVATQEPPAVMDAYKFVKLASVRHVMRAFVAKDAISSELTGREFRSVDELQALANERGPGAAQAVREALATFAVSLVINHANAVGRLNAVRLGSVIREFVGGRFRLAGVVPSDPAVGQAVVQFRPVVLEAPESPAADALQELCDKLLEGCAVNTWARPCAS